ncbi:MAG: hypothetical protein ACXV97_08030 [Chthoniobacterales bacterium]
MTSSAAASKESRPVFGCGDREFAVRDVVDAAHFRGELGPFWEQCVVRCAAAQKGDESGAALDDSAIDEASVAFRYQYDLITAEETEAWLEARGLTLAEFSEYFARLQWEKELAGRIATPSTPYHESSPGERDLLIVDLTLSGELDRMTQRLAWRVAAKDDGEASEEERKRFYARSGLDEPRVSNWLAGLDRDEDWLSEMLAMESAYQRQSSQRLTTEARERELTSLRLPLTRFEVEMIELESRDAAREAFMCVRDDGMTMDEVAREGRYPFRRTELVLEQIADEMQQKFLSLTPGSLLEPMAREDGFLLTRLLQKKEPKLDDADVRKRVEERILARHFSDLCSGRIQWRIAMNGAP